MRLSIQRFKNADIAIFYRSKNEKMTGKLYDATSVNEHFMARC